MGNDCREPPKTNLVGLFPLLPLTKDGKRHEVVEEMVTMLITVKQHALLRYAQMFSSLVFKDKDDRAWLERRFAMYKDILEESWVYQETKLKAELAAVRKSITNFVQARFPAMLEITKQKIDAIEDEDTLQRLLLQIGLAQNIEEALQALLDVAKNKQIN